MRLPVLCPLRGIEIPIPSRVVRSRQGEQALELFDQFAGADPDGLGHPQQGMETDPLLAAFDLADVNGMEVRFFGELFLAQPRLFAMVAD